MQAVRLMGAIVALSMAPQMASGKLSAERSGILDEIRAQALVYLDRLPNFVCNQTTYRETGTTRIGSNTTSDQVYSTDLIKEKLTYFHHQESYEVVTINRKKATGVQHRQVAGAISTGEFGSLLHDIFDPASHAVISWGREEKVHGKKVYVVNFHVPSSSGIRVSDKFSNQEISAAYGGLVLVDAETKEVMSITTNLELPPTFAIKVVERTVEYRPVEIAGKTYDLPFHSELRMQEGSNSYSNKIDFTDYHKFSVESTLLLGKGAGRPNSEAPAPAAAGSNEQASAQITPPTEPVPQSANPSQPLPLPEPLRGGSPAVSTAQASTATPATVPVSNAPVAPVGRPTIAVPEQPPTVNEPSQDTNFRLEVKSNTVLVPVVARDQQDRAVGNLVKENFQLFDRGKQQEITSFTVESHAGVMRPLAGSPLVPSQSPEHKAAENYIVYLFDDLHLNLADLARVRVSAGRSIDTLLPVDRAMIATTSGRLILDFTADHAQLHDALSHLQPSTFHQPGIQDCPDISYYMADQMLNVFDPSEIKSNPPLQAAVAETIACLSLSPLAAAQAQSQAIAKARSVLALGEQESRDALLSMKHIVHLITPAPGSKSIVLVSPGFGVGSELLSEEASLFDESIRANVIISALDARGVYVGDAVGDIQNRSASSSATRVKADLARDGERRNSGVLQELSAATGGTLVQNTNDLASGFVRLVNPPEYSYLLTFTPQKLKPDGSFHPLKVKLQSKDKLVLQARSGYYAPKK